MCSAFDSLVQGRCLVSDCDRQPSFKAGFHHTALVVRATLIAVFVSQVDLHSRDVIAESGQGIFHYVTNMSAQRLMAFDVMSSINLYLHGVLLQYLFGSTSVPSVPVSAQRNLCAARGNPLS
jgi:hypothetical protein